MNEKILVLLLAFFLFNFASVFGHYAKFNLAFTALGNQPSEQRLAIVENQVRPMVEAFGFDVDMGEFVETAIGPPYGWTDTLQLELRLAMPERGLTQADYSIIRDGVELNEVGDTVQLGDTIRFKPPEQGLEPTEEGHDWSVEGAYNDTPPIQVIQPGEFEALRWAFWDIYRSSNPCTMDRYGEMGAGCMGSIPLWVPKTSSFDPGTTMYTGDLGMPAYVVPMAGGKKAGIQVFCSVSVSAVDAEDPYSGSCNQNEFGGADCRMESPGETTIRVGGSGACVNFVDKVIKGNQATETDWFALGGLGYPFQGKTFQVLAGNEKAPVAEFSHEIIEEAGQEYIHCNASASYDPDGQIEKYEWDNGLQEGIEYRVPVSRAGQYSVTLKVTDNDGYSDTETKTISISPVPITDFTAFYNTGTQRVELELTCAEAGKAIMSIDREDKHANPILAEIEKQPIQCNQTTEVGPLEVGGNYHATVELGGTIEKHAFTID